MSQSAGFLMAAALAAVVAPVAEKVAPPQVVHYKYDDSGKLIKTGRVETPPAMQPPPQIEANVTSRTGADTASFQASMQKTLDNPTSTDAAETAQPSTSAP